MENTAELLKQQYAFIVDARSVLLDYCRAVRPEDFIRPNDSFGNGGSMRNLLVHVANSYEAWIVLRAFRQPFTRLKSDQYNNMNDIENLFSEVNKVMAMFLEQTNDWGRIIPYEVDGTKKTTDPFRLFSHVTTHEFHHKGQIVAIGRSLGYIPPDTDILR